MRKIRNFLTGIGLTIFLLLVWSCSKQKVTDRTEVATVGPRKITAHDFRIGYELAPPGEKKKTANILERKRAYLNKMVENNLLTIAGEERELDKTTDMQKLLKWYEKQEVIRELYRRVVHNKVKVSDEEARAAYKFFNEKLYLRQMIFKSRAEAEKVYRRIQQGEDFEKIAMERARSQQELNHILTPQEFHWGDLEERMEAAAYGLNLMETSAPIKTDIGYHLVQLVNRKRNMILTEAGYAERSHYIKTIIRRRKEARAAIAYVKKMLGPKHLKINGPVMLELTRRSRKILNKKELETAKIPVFAQERFVRPGVNDLLDKTLLLFEGGRWTVRDFFNRMEEMHPKDRPDLTNPGKLEVGLAIMFRDDFLAGEGYRRGMQNSENVRKELNRVRDEVVAKQMRHLVTDTVHVSEPQLRRFFAEHIKTYTTPEMVNIREIMVRDKKLADSLYQVIRHGGDLAKLVLKYSVRKWAVEKGGELGYFAPGAFGTVGEAAFKLKTGELSPPVPVKIDTFTVGYSVFRVVGRRAAVVPKLEAVHDRVQHDALAAKKKAVLERFLAGVKAKNPVRERTELLAKIKTSDELGKGRPMDMITVRPAN